MAKKTKKIFTPKKNIKLVGLVVLLAGVIAGTITVQYYHLYTGPKAMRITGGGTYNINHPTTNPYSDITKRRIYFPHHNQIEDIKKSRSQYPPKPQPKDENSGKLKYCNEKDIRVGDFKYPKNYCFCTTDNCYANVPVGNGSWKTYGCKKKDCYDSIKTAMKDVKKGQISTLKEKLAKFPIREVKNPAQGCDCPKNDLKCAYDKNPSAFTAAMRTNKQRPTRRGSAIEFLRMIGGKVFFDR